MKNPFEIDPIKVLAATIELEQAIGKVVRDRNLNTAEMLMLMVTTSSKIVGAAAKDGMQLVGVGQFALEVIDHFQFAAKNANGQFGADDAVIALPTLCNFPVREEMDRLLVHLKKTSRA